MTRSISTLLFLSALALAAPATAGAKPDAGASFTIDGGAVVFDHDIKAETGPTVGGRLGYDLTKHFGVEGVFNYTDSRSTATLSTPQIHGYTYHVDALGYFLPDSPVVPFIAAGVGGMSLRNHDTYGNQNSLLLNYGLGAKVFLTNSLALRVDARHLITFDNNYHNNGEFTAGVNYYFGCCKAAARPEAAQSESPSVAKVEEDDDLAEAPGAAPVAKTAPAAAAAPAVAAPVAPAVPAPQAAPAPAAPAPLPVESKAAPVATATEAANAPAPVAKAAAAVPMLMATATASDEAARDAANEAKEARQHPVVPAWMKTRITSVTPTKNGVQIATSCKAKEIKVVRLSKPTRLSIDVYTGLNATGTNKVAINTNGVTNVRLGNYPYKTRVVIDFEGDKLPHYRLVRSGKSLTIVLDKPKG